MIVDLGPAELGRSKAMFVDRPTAKVVMKHSLVRRWIGRAAVSWADGRLCGFDIETTGEEPDRARIVAATLVLVGANRPSHEFCLLIDPGVEIPAVSTAVHGITTEQARTEGRAPADALAEIVRLLRTTWERSLPVVAFNGSYDFTVLDRELSRHLDTGVAVTGPVVDPHIIDRTLDRRRGKRTLEETCRHYRVRLDGAHDATQDALAATRLAWRLAKLYPAEVGKSSLSELHDKQVVWSQQWADSLNQYWRSQGQDKTMDGTWPVRRAGTDHGRNTVPPVHQSSSSS